MTRQRRVAIGFSPHSGWAVLVAVAGDSAHPEVLLRMRIEMADPGLEGSKQPYHAMEKLPLAEAGRRLKRFEETARAMAHARLLTVVEELREKGYAPAAAGILDSSGRRGESLEATLASHALIHTADGNHFREALARASARCDLVVERVPKRELLARAATALGRKGRDVQASILALGKSVGRPWDADHKSAALLAWLLLAARPRRRK